MIEQVAEVGKINYLYRYGTSKTTINNRKLNEKRRAESMQSSPNLSSYWGEKFQIPVKGFLSDIRRNIPIKSKKYKTYTKAIEGLKKDIVVASKNKDVIKDEVSNWKFQCGVVLYCVF